MYKGTVKHTRLFCVCGSVCSQVLGFDVRFRMLGKMVAPHEALLALVALKPLHTYRRIHSTLQYRINMVHNITHLIIIQNKHKGYVYKETLHT